MKTRSFVVLFFSKSFPLERDLPFLFALQTNRTFPSPLLLFFSSFFKRPFQPEPTCRVDLHKRCVQISFKWHFNCIISIRNSNPNSEIAAGYCISVRNCPIHYGNVIAIPTTTSGHFGNTLKCSLRVASDETLLKQYSITLFCLAE
jgi:hypothetical protein